MRSFLRNSKSQTEAAIQANISQQRVSQAETVLRSRGCGYLVTSEPFTRNRLLPFGRPAPFGLLSILAGFEFVPPVQIKSFRSLLMHLCVTPSAAPMRSMVDRGLAAGLKPTGAWASWRPA